VLGQLGLDWADALLAFVTSGGTVVLLDGVMQATAAPAKSSRTPAFSRSPAMFL